MNTHDFQELSKLFFTTRRIIRSKLPLGRKADPNVWMRLEVLRLMGESEPSMQEIAQFLNVKAPSATSLVKNLKRAGLVRTASDIFDKRRTRIVLTATGEKELARYKQRATILMRDVFSPLGEKEVKHLIRILSRLVENHGRSKA